MATGIGINTGNADGAVEGTGEELPEEDEGTYLMTPGERKALAQIAVEAAKEAARRGARGSPFACTLTLHLAQLLLSRSGAIRRIAGGVLSDFAWEFIRKSGNTRDLGELRAVAEAALLHFSRPSLTWRLLDLHTRMRYREIRRLFNLRAPDCFRYCVLDAIRNWSSTVEVTEIEESKL